MTEQQALQRLKERDPEGLEWLIRRYTPYVGTVIWNIIGSAMTAQDAEELTSDVFLALWQNAGKARPGQVKSYLAAIARHKAINKLRERGVEPGSEEDVLALTAEGPEAAVEERELARLVRRGVDSLGVPDREIFLRFYYYCQSTARIGQEMGLAPPAVRKRLERGRDKLKRYFEEGGHSDALSDIV